MIIQELRSWGMEVLREKLPEIDDDSRRLEVDVLLSASLSISREQLLMRGRDLAPPEGEEAYRQKLLRRAAHEPVAYILGRREFYSLDFAVTPAVLIPRPETELIVERALSFFSGSEESFLLFDIGTGSGAIVLAILSEMQAAFGKEFLKRGRVVASDISTEALGVAALNATALGLEDHVRFVVADLLSAFALAGAVRERAQKRETLVLVVCNPPYVRTNEALSPDVAYHEPELALFAGKDGLDVIRSVVTGVSQLWGGLPAKRGFLMEIGAGQEKAVRPILERHFESEAFNVSFVNDLQGIPRLASVVSR